MDEYGYIRQSDYIRLIFIYLFVNLARFISLGVFYKYLVKWGYGMTGKEVNLYGSI